jgi:hypothetical protein
MAPSNAVNAEKDYPVCCWSHCTTAAPMPSSDSNLWPLDCQTLASPSAHMAVVEPFKTFIHCHQEIASLFAPRGSLSCMTVSMWPAPSRELWTPWSGRRWTTPIQSGPTTVWFPCVQPPQDVLKASRFWSDEGVKAVVVPGSSISWCNHGMKPLHPWGQFWWPLPLCSVQSLNGFHFKKWPHAYK